MRADWTRAANDNAAQANAALVAERREVEKSEAELVEKEAGRIRRQVQGYLVAGSRPARRAEVRRGGPDRDRGLPDGSRRERAGGKSTKRLAELRVTTGVSESGD